MAYFELKRERATLRLRYLQKKASEVKEALSVADQELVLNG